MPNGGIARSAGAERGLIAGRERSGDVRWRWARRVPSYRPLQERWLHVDLIRRARRRDLRAVGAE